MDAWNNLSSDIIKKSFVVCGQVEGVTASDISCFKEGKICEAGLDRLTELMSEDIDKVDIKNLCIVEEEGDNPAFVLQEEEDQDEMENNEIVVDNDVISDDTQVMAPNNVVDDTITVVAPNNVVDDTITVVVEEEEDTINVVEEEEDCLWKFLSLEEEEDWMGRFQEEERKQEEEQDWLRRENLRNFSKRKRSEVETSPQLRKRVRQ